jgi:hypothetical protein
MVIENKLEAVMALLQTAAQRRAVCSFPSLHGLFDQSTPRNDIYDTLEEASLALAPSEVAIYSALMAKKGTLVPGSGFFDIFRNKREADYDRLAGRNVHPTALNDQQMATISQLERLRVYSHATNHV